MHIIQHVNSAKEEKKVRSRCSDSDFRVQMKINCVSPINKEKTAIWSNGGIVARYLHKSIRVRKYDTRCFLLDQILADPVADLAAYLVHERIAQFLQYVIAQLFRGLENSHFVNSNFIAVQQHLHRKT